MLYGTHFNSGGIVMPAWLVQIALILIVIRSVYMTFTLSQHSKKPWIDLLHYISVAIVAMSFLLH